MSTRAASWELCWNWQGISADASHASQRWVLEAMRKHGHGLVTMLWRILGNEQDVCDAYQDTFLRLANYDASLRKQQVV